MKINIREALLLIIMYSSCERPELIKPAGFETVIAADSVVFAQIGDYGFSGQPEKAVSDMVKSWAPDFIISVGDNNYPEGKFNSIKENISNYYCDYIFNFDAPAEYRCHGKAFTEKINRFFPCPGNHDANNRDELIPYYNFFTLPGNEISYWFTWGPVTFFSVNTVTTDPLQQKTWLQQEMASSMSAFKIVFLHYPPYCSGPHGNNTATQWDFYGMGADIVFSGHDHVYQRIQKSGEEEMIYIINGLGGKGTSDCLNTLPTDTFESYCYGIDYGAVKCMVTEHKLILEFYAVSHPEEPVDHFELTK